MNANLTLLETSAIDAHRITTDSHLAVAAGLAIAVLPQKAPNAMTIPASVDADPEQPAAIASVVLPGSGTTDRADASLASVIRNSPSALAAIL